MKRSACLLSLMSLLAAACGDSGKGSGEESNSESNSNTMSSNSITITASASATETASATDGTASASATEGTTAGTTPTEASMSSEPTGGNTTFDPNDCGESVVNIPIVTPSVMLVLDKSGSMVATPGGFWDHDADDANDDGIQDADPMMMAPATPKITRWESLWSVVDLIANGFNGSMNMGMILFPSKAAKADYSAVACVVNAAPEVPVGPMSAADIIAAIPPAKADKTVIQGGTPATKGVVAAVAELHAELDRGVLAAYGLAPAIGEEELRLHLLALGDVPPHAGDANDPPLQIAIGRAGPMVEHRPAVFRQQMAFQLRIALVVGLPDGGGRLLRFFGRHHVQRRLTLQFLARIARHRFQSQVPFGHPAIQIQRKNYVRDGLHDRLKVTERFSPFPICLFTFGDIGDRPDHAQGESILRSGDDFAAVKIPSVVARFLSQPNLDFLHRNTAIHVCLQHVRHSSHILRMHKTEKEGCGRSDFLGRVSQ